VVTNRRPPWTKSVERTWKERSAEASAPKVRRAAQHAQSQEIEAATDGINPAKQQKKVKSPYYKSSVHTGGYEPQWSEGAVFGSAHGPHPQAKSDDVKHTTLQDFDHIAFERADMENNTNYFAEQRRKGF
jgi:hypothetical protein